MDEEYKRQIQHLQKTAQLMSQSMALNLTSEIMQKQYSEMLKPINEALTSLRETISMYELSNISGATTALESISFMTKELIDAIQVPNASKLAESFSINPVISEISKSFDTQKFATHALESIISTASYHNDNTIDTANSDDIDRDIINDTEYIFSADTLSYVKENKEEIKNIITEIIANNENQTKSNNNIKDNINTIIAIIGLLLAIYQTFITQPHEIEIHNEYHIEITEQDNEDESLKQLSEMAQDN